MAKKPKPKNKVPSKKYSKYKLEGDKVERKATCPKCGNTIGNRRGGGAHVAAAK